MSVDTKGVRLANEDLRSLQAEQAITKETELTPQAASLRRIFVWMAACGFGLMPLLLLVSLELQVPVLTLLSGAPLAVACAALGGLELLRRGWLAAALLLVAAVTAVVSLVAAAVAPPLVAALILVPVMLFVLILPYVAARPLLMYSLGCLVVTTLIFLLGSLPVPLGTQFSGQQGLVLGAGSVALAAVVLLLMLWQFIARLRTAIAQARATSLALRRAQVELEDLVVARTSELQAALDDVRAHAEFQSALLAENVQQRATIREMGVPILPVSPRAIVIPLIGALDGERLQALQDQALRAIQQRTVRHVLLDLTGVPLLDTQVAQALLSVVHSARLLGAEVVLVGVRPEVAQMVVSLGLHMGGVVTRHSLQQGILYTLGRERLGAQSA